MERYAKRFKSWTHVVSMLFCHLGHTRSLREICYGLSCCNGKLRHLGIVDGGPKRTTLAYANEKRNWRFFQDLFYEVLGEFRNQPFGSQRKKRFRFKNKLLSLDASVISVCLDMFPWAEYKQTKGGVKLNVLLDHDDYMPRFVQITEAKVADVRIAQSMKLPKGSLVAMDRGYNDYGLFADWTENSIFFVTRLKKNASYQFIQCHEPTPETGNIKSDVEIAFKAKKARKKLKDKVFRKVTVRDPETGEDFVLLTNNMKLKASTISGIYRDRWEIEKFFRLLKQNLKVKTFVGTSENALQVQIWTALLSLLLIKWLHYLSKAGWSFSNMAVLLRMNLFTCRRLKAWLDDPFEIPPQPPRETQMTLGF